MPAEPTITYLEDVLRALARHQVQFVVAGGVAAVLHGVERTTLDLDIALEMSPENVERFVKAVSELGLRPLVPIPVEALANPNAVRKMVEEKNAIVFMLADPSLPLRKVDVFLTPDLAYDVLVGDAVQVDLDGHMHRIVSVERLLSLKKAIHPPRDKDIFDISVLEKLERKRTDES